MKSSELEAAFRPSPSGSFRSIDGVHRSEKKGRSPQKLCVVSTCKDALLRLLYETSKDPACYFVKYAVRPRGGMYVGRCTFMDSERAGELWRALRSNTALVCTVQDDDYVEPYRANDSVAADV